jgi:hypothetical protein
VKVFFFGGTAAETQAQRAKEFRGTINNHAWTIGRGAANVVFTPGTKEYSLLSGFFDAAVTFLLTQQSSQVKHSKQQKQVSK